MWSVRKLLVALVLFHLCVLTAVQFFILRRVYRKKTSHPAQVPDYANYTNWSDEMRQKNPEPMVDYGAIDFLIDEPDFCERRRPEVKIVFYLHTAPENSEQRDLIRQTWGSHQFYDQLRMATVFFVGRPSAAELQQSIDDESATHHDVIQIDVDDDYYNLTYKAVTALDWIRRRCAGAEIALKTDDDVIVDVFRFVREMVADVHRTAEDYVYCYAHSKMTPYRKPMTKRYVTRREYPWDLYPDFCSGMAVYFRSSVIPKLLNVTHRVPFLKFEDVYVTGLLRTMAGVQIRNVPEMVSILDNRLCPAPDASEIFCHVSDIDRKWDLWMDLLLAEMAKLSRNDEERWGSYVSSLYDIIGRDVEGLLPTA